MKQPTTSVQLSLFGGLDLSALNKPKVEEGGGSTVSLAQHRQQELSQAIQSKDEARVAEAIASFSSASGLPPTVEGKRLAELLADHFCPRIAARLQSAGMAVPNTSSFLSYLHDTGSVECVDWFLRNTRLGEMPALEDRSDVFFRTVRAACQSGNYELGMYYLDKCPLTTPQARTCKGARAFFPYCLDPVLASALNSSDAQKVGAAILAIHRHGLLLPVVHALSTRLEMTDLACIQKACTNPEVSRTLSSLFPIKLDLEFYCQSTLAILDVRVPEQTHLQAENFIELAALRAAPAVSQLLAHPVLGPKIASALVDRKDTPRRLAYLSYHAQERRLPEIVPDLFAHTHAWRDKDGNNVGHYLAARPTSDTRQERIQMGPSAHNLTASYGPGSRGELLVQHARQWCLEENKNGKTPLAFIVPKARANLTRQLLRSMAPSRSREKRGFPGM